MFVTKKAFDEVGGFDERLETNEDYDFCHRLRQRGYVLLSVPTIKVTHLRTPQTLRGLFRNELWHGRDVFRVFLASGRELKNLRAVALALFYVVCMLAVGMSIVFFVAGGSYLPVFGSFLLAVSVPCFLALKTCWVNKQYKYFFALTLLYFVYGVARALCIVNLQWLRKKKAG
jgi:hypothetical protein